MAPGEAAIYLDECIPIQVTEGLVSAGWDALAARDAQRLGLHDAPQLQFAASHGRILLTFDPDYLEHHTEWLAAGKEHAGILLSAEYKDIKRYLADLRHTFDVFPATAFHNALLWVLKG